ncbi:glycosyltransferase [Knoellia aerolata]|nr:glycosyltransferase [Knoellia aerolata]
MKLLFVSGTTGGGSGRSQRELAKQLMLLGTEVTFIVDDKRRAPVRRWAYAHLSDLSVRLDGRMGARLVTRARDVIGRRTHQRIIDGLEHLTSPVPQNAAARYLATHPVDAVVANSVERWAWRRLHSISSTHGFPTILYVREVDSLGHLNTGATPTVLIANAASLAEQLRGSGFDCAFLPSVIDTTVTSTSSTRRVAMAINPIPDKGSHLMWAMADLLPDVAFVVQESWPLTGALEESVLAQVAARPNVEFRRCQPPGPSLYEDTRVLLVPYQMDSRPRVILEAQANGIPVIVGDVPSLREAIGEGGLIVDLDSPTAWAAAIRSLWEDEGQYRQLATRARAHGERREVDPEGLARTFLELAQQAVRPSQR